ncbi:MAG TPA: serine/threonine-protein kinase [Candidatus Limnocylindrales bacterium]|nr:serine/threonine-protein kinase [Candidatus Limnocylindrales bacterium]
MAGGKPLRRSDPTQLGRYTLLKRLGEGGMGSVYLAQAPEGLLVALKVIRRDLASDPDFRRRFRGEVTAVRRVPAFCTAEVLDADPEHDPPYLVVEFVDGPSLSDVVNDRGPLGDANVHGLAIGVATALTGIHGAGVIHRDLKPSNVLLALGSAKVIDFGIARLGDPMESTATDPNQLIGSIPYMAPERLDPKRVTALTAASDIFSWGAVVVYAATGRPPFGEGGVEAAARILTQPPDLTGVKGPLRELVERALAKEPGVRPSARALLDRLVSQEARGEAEQLIAAGQQLAVVDMASTTKVVAQPPIPDTEPLPPPRRARRVVVPLLASGLVLVTAAMVGALTGLIQPFGGVAKTSVSEPTLEASPSPSSQPSSQPSPRPSWTVFVRDPLTKAGPFWYDRDETVALQAKCALSGALVVTQTRLGTYRCTTHPDPLTDFAASVDVAVRTNDACGGIWFRFAANKGYLLMVCLDRYQLYEHAETLSVVRSAALPAPIALNTRFRVTIVAEGSALKFVHNGLELFSATRTTYASGRVVLGIVVPTGARPAPRYEVAFNDIEITTPHL